MSRLQEIARNRNSSKGRIKGLRNNIRGMIKGKSPHLTEDEIETLIYAEKQFDEILQDWDEQWEDLKSLL